MPPNVKTFVITPDFLAEAYFDKHGGTVRFEIIYSAFNFFLLSSYTFAFDGSRIKTGLKGKPV